MIRRLPLGLALVCTAISVLTLLNPATKHAKVPQTHDYVARSRQLTSHVENLNGRVFLEPIHIELHANSRVLDASERRERMQAPMLIHPCGSALQSRRYF
jgi:hypothetical protein